MDHKQNSEQRTRAEALAANIALRLGLCSLDELRVIDVTLSRLELGRDQYGPLDLAHGSRDWRREEAEEHVDANFYRACHRIARQDEEREQLRCEAADEMSKADPVLAGLRELAAAPVEVPVEVCGLIGTRGVDLHEDETPPPLPPAPRPADSMFDVSDLEDRHE